VGSRNATRLAFWLATLPLSRTAATSATPGPAPARLTAPKIVVKKADRRLELYSSARLVRSYRIGLGLSPAGDKAREGDRRTPEGSFYVTDKNRKSKFFRSLRLSYPNIAAAERGRRARLITQWQYRRIVRAIRRGGTPAQNTPLGGEILIHGGGAQRDWTWGCVALDNRDVQELFGAVPVGTPVLIKP
jgi:murein L,D-transpeptidase YafK